MQRTLIKTRRVDNKSEFFMSVNGAEYYLFAQPYYKLVDEYFGAGLPIDRALRHRDIGSSDILHRTIDRILSRVRYVEKLTGIAVLKQTRAGGRKKHYSRVRVNPVY